MQRVMRILDNILETALVGLMMALVLSVSWQVISRYVFAAPSSWTEEAARFLMIWVGLLGAAYAFRRGAHLGLDILPKKLTGRSAQALRLFTMLAVVLFSVAALVIGGGSLVYMTWELRQHSAVLGLPIAVVYSVIPLAGVMICLYAVAAVTGDGVADVEAVKDAGI